MENYVGLLYNSGTTQQGLGYKNGFGSVYSISGSSTTYTPTSSFDQSQINIIGINQRILETEGFIFWTKFKINSTIDSLFQYFNSYTQYFGLLNSGFSFSVSNAGMTFNLCNTSTQVASFFIPHSLIDNSINSSSDKTSSFSVLVYKDPNKNFTTPSAFTTYANNYKSVISTSIPYAYNALLVNGTTAFPIRCLFKGSFPSDGSYDCPRVNAYVYNIGLAKTTMTPAEFDLFAQKMIKHDNYWHLFEGETDTKNINPSEIIFYTPFYQKFGGNNIRTSSINIMYPKTGVTATTLSNTGIAGRAKLNMTLGPLNRWRKPYPPFDPYI